MQISHAITDGNYQGRPKTSGFGLYLFGGAVRFLASIKECTRIFVTEGGLKDAMRKT